MGTLVLAGYSKTGHMAVVAAVAAAAAGTIIAGASIAGVASAFSGCEYNVAFKMEVENYTNHHLSVHESKTNGGLTSEPPVDIKPGVKEALTGHKVGHTATGCSGTVSWTIGDSDKILVVMYDVPYSHDFYSNHCAVGIFDKGDTGGHYKMMRYNEDECFKKKDFYYDVDPVGVEIDDFTVVATMGSSHKPEIEVRLYPNSVDNLANKHAGEKKFFGLRIFMFTFSKIAFILEMGSEKSS